jgi:hypothetical protein
MEELVIRFGSWEGPRNPNSEHIRQALEDIESGACGRPEFTIENVSNWKPAIENGRRVVRHVMEGRYTSAATFYIKGNSTPLGWFVCYHAEDDSMFALAAADNNEGKYVEGICCGGPLAVRTICLVSPKLALDALAYFAQYRDRSPDHSWIVRSDCWRLE